MIQFGKKIGPASIFVELTQKHGAITLGNLYRTGMKFGVIWRMPRLQIGGFNNAQYGWRDPEMDNHKYNIRIGS